MFQSKSVKDRGVKLTFCPLFATLSEGSCPCQEGAEGKRAAGQLPERTEAAMPPPLSGKKAACSPQLAVTVFFLIFAFPPF